MSSTLITGASSVGVFSSRAFLPAFAAALLLRFGPDWGLSGIDGHRHVAPWFTSNVALCVLGFLAVLELTILKSHNARKLLAEIDHYGKPLMALLTQLGLASVANQQSVGDAQTFQHTAVPDILSYVFVAAGTYFVATARNRVMRLLMGVDSDNSTGIHGVISWIEDAWGIFGMVFIILFPAVMLALIGLAVAGLFVLRWRAYRKEEKSKVACGVCQSAMYRSALACPSCRAPNPLPCRVNWLGASTDRPAELARHPYLLAAKRRCPTCASRLKGWQSLPACGACGDHHFTSAAFLASYDEHLRRGLKRMLVICFILGLVPVFGMPAGLIYYGIVLVSPYRAYVPFGRSVLLRWGLRVFFVAFFWLQPIPLMGAAVVPIMAFVSYWAYRSAFIKATKGWASPPAEVVRSAVDTTAKSQPVPAVAVGSGTPVRATWDAPTSAITAEAVALRRNTSPPGAQAAAGACAPSARKRLIPGAAPPVSSAPVAVTPPPAVPIVKACAVCGVDVSKCKRVRDQKGRYYCHTCWPITRDALRSASTEPPPAKQGLPNPQPPPSR
jgi:hypothetical protein